MLWKLKQARRIWSRSEDKRLRTQVSSATAKVTSTLYKAMEKSSCDRCTIVYLAIHQLLFCVIFIPIIATPEWGATIFNKLDDSIRIIIMSLLITSCLLSLCIFCYRKQRRLHDSLVNKDYNINSVRDRKSKKRSDQKEQEKT